MTPLHWPDLRRLSGTRLGWPGLAGVAGLALGLGFYLGAVQPAQQRLDAARGGAQALQARVAQADPAGGLPIDEQLAAFYRLLPPEAQATDGVGRIVAIAQRAGLSVQQAEYQALRDAGGRLTHLQMDLPLRADYPSLRRFLAALRTGAPFVALEQVQFERQKVGDPRVEAKVRLVLFLRRSP